MNALLKYLTVDAIALASSNVTFIILNFWMLGDVLLQLDGQPMHHNWGYTIGTKVLFVCIKQFFHRCDVGCYQLTLHPNQLGLNQEMM